jgi:HEAT repeat protein
VKDLQATLALLLDDPPEARAAALEALEALYVHCDNGTCTTDPEIARIALPQAIAALDHRDAGVRITAAMTIRLLASDGGPAVAALASALADPAAEVRLAILGALGELGRTAVAAAPPVGERLAHGASSDERSAAAYALGNMGAPDAQVELLVAALIGDEPAVQAGAAYALSIALERGESRASRALHQLRRS